MKYFTLLSFFVAFSFFTVSGQNKYLSFIEGESNKTSVSTIPKRVVANLKSNSLEIGYKFTGATISETDHKKTIYNYIHIEGLHKMNQIGAPAMPAKNEIIAVPRGSKCKITILEAKYYEYQGYNIYPALEPARDTEGAPAPKFQRDEKIYGANKFFPENIVEVISVGKRRGTGLAKTQIRPIQFNPVTNIIRVYTDIKFKVEFEGGEGNFNYITEDNSINFTNQLKLSVLNSDAIPDGIKKNKIDAKAGEKEYIIITHSQYIDQANELANWKRQLGYSVEVISQSSWTTTQIKSEISDRYTNWTPKPDYCVIIGDHTGSYAVPGEIYATPWDDGNFATDLYYFCMDGTGDYHPDMARGRISVSSVEEAQILIDKIINYELNPPTEATFYTNALNCAQWQDTDDNDSYADRRFCHTSENIRDYLQNEQGYTSTRIYYRETGGSTADVSTLKYNNGFYSDGSLLPSELRTGTFDWSGDQNNITSEINTGKFLVFHRDHGYTGGSGWAHPYYTTTTMNSLANGYLLPVIFSMNCHTGEYQLDNCFAEKFLRMNNKGAVGVFGAAYYSLSGWNDALSVGMIDAIWADPGIYPVFGTGGSGNNYTIGTGNSIYTMGDVLNQGLIAMEQNWGDASYDDYEYELFHYFGDPAMRIWTENPNPNAISATHDATIDCANTSFSISNSTPGANATLIFNNELLGETVLDGSGNGSVSYIITIPGDVTLTISKHNCKPYVSNLTQTCSGYPPTVITDATTDITISSAILNGEITNDNGETVSESGFVYSLISDPLVGGADVTQVLTSPTVSMGTYNELISGLNSSTTYYYKAYAINANGTSYGNQEVFTTSCGTFTLPFTEDFSAGTLPLCWENIDIQGNGQIWEFNNPGGVTVNTTTSANGFAILDSDNYGNGNSQNADLVTPAINMSNFTDVTLNFEHYFRSYSGSSATLSYSIDGGNNWVVIQSWSSTTTNAESFNQAVSAVNGEADVRFKWNYTGSWGYYWAIDDINITGTPTIITLNWDGSTNNDWQTTTNWTPAQVPTSAEDVNIPAGLTNYPIIDDGATVAECNNLTIESDANITIAVNGDMTVSGNIINNAGYTGLVINSDASGTGSLIHNTDNNVDATVNCFFSASPEAWHLISSPIITAPLSLLPTTNNLYFYDETNNDFWSGTTNGTGSVSGWTPPTGNLVSSVGYYYYYYQTTLEYQGGLNNNSNGNNINIDYTEHTGTAPNGVPYSDLDGWNLIGNPFTSAIDWTQVDAGAANLNNAVYTYDGTNYRTWVFGASTNDGSNIIPAMQGFFVKGNNSAGGTLNIPVSAKINSDQAFWKSNSEQTPDNLIKLEIEAADYKDETVVRISEDATNFMDGSFDAYKRFSMNSNVPQIYTLDGNETEYSINTLSNFDDEISIPLKIFNNSENYTVNVKEFNFNDINVYLKDKLNGITQQIVLNDVLTFNKNDKDNTDRYEMVLIKKSSDILNLQLSDVMIYPNPNKGSFYLTVNTANKYEVQILNITGKIVYNNTFENNYSKLITLNNQPKGVYIIKVRFSDKSVLNKKVILQ